MYQSGHDGGQFVFFKRQTQNDRWQGALHQNNEAGYLKYLDEYPNGDFVLQAEENMRNLADEKAWQLGFETGPIGYLMQWVSLALFRGPEFVAKYWQRPGQARNGPWLQIPGFGLRSELIE